ncbi:MAG: RluA family pseudouridine synthase [Simkaniaceae bacterium]|nr:RluA family pseudouridine synthase [Simkaniaceae bacterium]
MKKKLIDRLKEQFSDSSKNTLKQWVQEGRIAVDGKVCLLASTPIEETQVLTLKPRSTHMGWKVDILYEDLDIVVVRKPSGLLSVDKDDEREMSLHRLLKRRRQRVYPVHRLDKAASGVLVFTYSEFARDGLKNQFAAHTTYREYRAVVEGILETPSGSWINFLKEDKALKMYVAEEGKEAITHFEVLKTMKDKDATLLKITLETGRKNQIRVQCSEAGHPICGDRKYGSQTNPYKRLALHALLLEFNHPVTGKRMRFTDENALPLPLG